MVSHARKNGWSAGNFKKLNLPFENRLLGQHRDIRERMVARVEEFAFNIITNVLNSGDTAPLAVEQILAAGSPDPGPKAKRIEDPKEWTAEKISARAADLPQDEGPPGDFDD